MFDYYRSSRNAHQVCCEDSLTKGLYYNLCQSDDLDLHFRSQLRLKLDFCLICRLIAISQYLIYGIQTWHDGRLIMHGIYTPAHFDDLHLDFKTSVRLVLVVFLYLSVFFLVSFLSLNSPCSGVLRMHKL